MLRPCRIRVLQGFLVALVTVTVGCGGDSPRSAGKDAGQTNPVDLGRDTVERQVDSNGESPIAAGDGAIADDRRADAPPIQGPDTLLAVEAGASEALQDGSTDTVGLPDAGVAADAGAVDARSGDDVLDDASPDRRQEDQVMPPDVPVFIDTPGPDTQAPEAAGVDSVPSLQLLAGGLGGAGTQDGTGAGARFCMPTGVISDGQGNLYVADFCNHAIRKVVVATGEVTTLAGALGEDGWADGVGSEARFALPTGIASDGQGNLFITEGGTHVIRQIVIATREVRTIAGAPGESGSVDGIGSAARFSSPWGMVYDGAGTLYITDSGTSIVRKLVLATGAVTTLAGSAGNPGNHDGIGTSAQFAAPRGVALDGAGALLIADTENSALRRLVLATGDVTTVDKTTFPRPSALASDGKGTFYVVDSSDMTFRRLVLATGEVSLLAGDVQNAGTDDGTGAAARFYVPAGVALDGVGNAFIADSANQLLRKVVLATRVVTTLAGRAQEKGSADGTGKQARFQFQSNAGLVSDGQGHLFVADSGNHTLRKIVVATAEVTTFAGAAGDCTLVDGTGGDARFCYPTSMASDGNGNLFVADTWNHAIRKVVLATATVSTLAGAAGTVGSEDGVGAAARFSEVVGIAADAAGNVYVADTDNNTIRQISVASGLVTTLAGAAGLQGDDDGIGSRARFNRPMGLALDGAGALLVADRDNGTIRRIVLSTAVVTTIAGTAGNSGSEDGIGREATFGGLAGLAIDDSGDLFVADAANQSVRKVVLGTGAVTTVVGSSHRVGVGLGALPASLGGPIGLAFVAPGTLFIADAENAVLLARF